MIHTEDINQGVLVEPVQAERAKFGDRFFAAIVDNIMLGVFIRILSLLGGMLFAALHWSEISHALIFGLLIPLVFILSYFAVYAQRHNGQTLGKKWNKVRVVDKNGNDLVLGHFLLRELVARGIPILLTAILGYYGLLWYLTYLFALGNNRLALHDMIVGTQVVKTKFEL